MFSWQKSNSFVCAETFFLQLWSLFLGTFQFPLIIQHRGGENSPILWKNILSGTMCWRISHPAEHILMGTRCVEGFCRYSNFAGTCQTWPSDQNCIFSLFKDGNILSANVLKGREGTTTSSLNHSFWQTKKTSTQAR